LGRPVTNWTIFNDRGQFQEILTVARTPAKVTQADIARAIRAAKQAGAAEVEVRIGDRSAIVIRISPSTGTGVPGLEQSAEIVL